MCLCASTAVCPLLLMTQGLREGEGQADGMSPAGLAGCRNRPLKSSACCAQTWRTIRGAPAETAALEYFGVVRWTTTQPLRRASRNQDWLGWVAVFSPQCGLCGLPDWWKGRRFILKSRGCRNGAPAARSFGGRASRLLCSKNSLENCFFSRWLFDHRRTAQTISICRHAAARVTCVLNGFQFVIANLG